MAVHYRQTEVTMAHNQNIVKKIKYIDIDKNVSFMLFWFLIASQKKKQN